MRNLCFQPHRRFFHEELGWNYRMTNLQAALGVSQIGRLQEIVATKRYIVATYRQLLAEIPGLSFQSEEPWARSVAWVAGVLLDEDHPMNASEVMARMKAAGIETRPFFLGMHEQPVFQRMGLFVGDRFPVAERLARKGFYLPNGLALQPAQLEQVAETLAGIVTAAAPRRNTTA
jgi:perosamine synthetase